MSDTTPTLDTSSPQTFAAYLISTVLSDPRTKAQIGSAIRWLLHGAGVALAAYPVGHLFAGVANHADWIMLAAGGILSVSQLVWRIYQDFRVDRKLAHKDAIIADAKADTAQVAQTAKEIIDAKVWPVSPAPVAPQAETKVTP
jgi:type II secretory pathway component PulM